MITPQQRQRLQFNIRAGWSLFGLTKVCWILFAVFAFTNRLAAGWTLLTLASMITAMIWISISTMQMTNKIDGDIE